MAWNRRAVPIPVRERSAYAPDDAFALVRPLRVRGRDRIVAALNPEYAVVPGEVDPVVGGETGEDVAARVNGPEKTGSEGDTIAQPDSGSLSPYEGVLLTWVDALCAYPSWTSLSG